MTVTAGPTHAATGGVTFTLDNVQLSVQSPSLPSTTFSIAPAGSLTLGATSTSLRPFHSLSIITVPYGTTPNQLNLPQAAAGSASVYATDTHTALTKQHATFAPGPAAQLFGVAVSGEASRLSREVPGVSGAQLVDSMQWITEAGNRVWIVTDLEQASGPSQSLASHANQFAAGLIISSANPGAATSLGHSAAQASTQSAPQADVQAPFIGAAFLGATSDTTHTTHTTHTTQAAPEQPQRATSAALPTQYGGLAWPHWWSGTCNVNNYPPGHLLTTGQGKLGGLEICSPSSTTLGGSVWVPFDGYGALQWQCVELSLRYMDIAWGVHPYSMNDAYTIATDFPFSTYPNIEKIPNNGVAGVIPQPGDVMQLSENGSNPDPGHTGVVESVSVNSSGNGYIVFDSENGNLNGRYDLYVGSSAGLPAWEVGGDGVNYTTAWLHNPNDTQTNDYVYAVGQNGDLYQYQWSSSTSWLVTDLGQPGVALTGVPSGHTEIQDGGVVQDVYVNDTNGRLHEYWYQNGAWGNGTLSPPSGVMFIGSPSAFSYTLPAQTSENHSVFDIGNNGHLYNYSWHEGGSGWTLTDLTATTGGYVSAAWAPSAQAFLQSGSEVQDVYASTPGYALAEFWWNGTWHYDSPGSVAPLPSGVNMWSNPSAMTFSYPNSYATVRHSIFFTGSNNHLYDYQWAQGSSWSLTDVTNSVGGAAMEYAPSANFLVQSGSGVQDVFVGGTDGDIHEFYFSQSNNAWRTDDISVAASATGYTIIGGPSSFSNFLPSAPMNARHSVFVVTSDGMLREFLWVQSTTPWELIDHGAPANTILNWAPGVHSF